MNEHFECRVFPFRLATAFSLALGVAALASLPGPAAATDWPQASSDVRADPAVLFGTLPNGMRYAIMHNTTPKGAVSMWLNIGSGSFEESDAQQGLAHFLEHMAFRGSRHVPESDVWPGLQRLGMAVGADANAATDMNYTQYQFNFPRNDAETIDTGLMRLRDIAGELTLAQSAMDAERGVILSEERLRDTPAYRMIKQEYKLLFPRDRMLSRFPIGSTDIIKHAPVSLICDYYAAYYRPGRATLIVVGEIDPQAIQSKITRLFADWKPAGVAGLDPARTVPAARGPEAELFSEPDAPSILSFNWTASAEPDTKARERGDFTKLVALKIIEYRLRNATKGSEHPFAEVQVHGHRDFPGQVIWSVDTAIRPQDWRIALDAAALATRRMETYGITAGELLQAENEIRAVLENAAANGSTRKTREVAETLAKSVNEKEVFESPADMLALADETFKTLTVEKVNAALRAVMRGHGPLVFLSTPTPIDGGKATVSAALAAAEKVPLAAAVAETPVTWPYTNFGPAGRVVDRKTIEDLQTTFIRFANGVRLTVKPTAFKASEIVVGVRVGHGRLDLPTDRDTSSWAVADRGLVGGGLKAISFEDMQRALSGKVYRTDASVTDDGLMLWGRTRSSDLATQMQVFAAYVSVPGWRAGAMERARTLETIKLQQSEASPTGRFIREISCLLRVSDRRWCAPSPAELAHVAPDALKDMLAPALASAPIEVTMAGDVTVDAAIAAVARTLGALPARTGADAVRSTTLRFPSGNMAPVELRHNGRADQGVAAMAWPTTDAFDLNHIQNLRVLKSVITTRAMNQLRIQDAATYSPAAFLVASMIAPGYGYLVAMAELPPAKMPLFFKTTESIATDLRAHAISTDELERARRPDVESILTEQQTNEYWAAALVGAQQDPRRLDIIRDTVPYLQKVTAEDVRQAANTYLSDSKAWKLEIKAAPIPAGLH